MIPKNSFLLYIQVLYTFLYTSVHNEEYRKICNNFEIKVNLYCYIGDWWSIHKLLCYVCDWYHFIALLFLWVFYVLNRVTSWHLLFDFSMNSYVIW